MPTKIFVGNIPAGATEDVINDLFLSYGAVTEIAILGSYGFVHMANATEADAAIAELNGYTMMGCRLNVELSTPNTQGKKKSFQKQPTTKVFIGNINLTTTNDDLRKMFEPYGEVAEADVVGGFAFVHMANESEAKEAIRALDGTKLNGNQVNIELSTNRTQGKMKEKMESGFARGRGRGSGGMRFDPYTMSSNGGRRPFPAPDMYAARDYDPYPPLRRPLPPIPRPEPIQQSGDSFARELLELYSKNPKAFDAYARDPLVRQALNVTTPLDRADDPYYRPPHDYYEQKMNARLAEISTASAPYGSLSSGGYSGMLRDPGAGLSSAPSRYSLLAPPTVGASLAVGGPTMRSRMPAPPSSSSAHLYTSFE